MKKFNQFSKKKVSKLLSYIKTKVAFKISKKNWLGAERVKLLHTTDNPYPQVG